MDTKVELVQIDCDLVARDGQELDQPQLEALRAGVSLLERREKLCNALAKS